MKNLIFIVAIFLLVGCSGNSYVDADCEIKGNISSSGEKIYHVPGCASYDRTVISPDKGEEWFCSENDAVGSGWRKARNCY